MVGTEVPGNGRKMETIADVAFITTTVRKRDTIPDATFITTMMRKRETIPDATLITTRMRKRETIPDATLITTRMRKRDIIPDATLYTVSIKYNNFEKKGRPKQNRTAYLLLRQTIAQPLGQTGLREWQQCEEILHTPNLAFRHAPSCKLCQNELRLQRGTRSLSLYLRAARSCPQTPSAPSERLGY